MTVPVHELATEILSRIALMSGTGFGAADIASRISIDTGVHLGTDMIQILQAEMGMVKAQPRLELQSRLIGHGVPVLDAASLASTIHENPVRVGIELASRGLLGKGSRILLGLPRAVAAACRAGAELWRVANGHTVLPLGKLKRLMEEAQVKQKDLTSLFPGKTAAFRGTELQIRIPGGSNPFRHTKT